MLNPDFRDMLSALSAEAAESLVVDAERLEGRGDIVGWAWTSDGGSHAALWTR